MGPGSVPNYFNLVRAFKMSLLGNGKLYNYSQNELCKSENLKATRIDQF